MAEGGSRRNGGWVKIYRSIQDNCIWNDKPFSKGQAWVDLILLAKHQDEKFVDKRGRVIDGKRGHIYMSESGLAERWGWSRKKVDNFLSQLEQEQEIETVEKSTTEGTTIFIVNYDKFQTPGTSKRTSKEQLENSEKHNSSTYTRRYKKNKKDKEKENREKSATRPVDTDAADEEEEDDDSVDLGAMTDEEFERYLEATHHGAV